MKTIFILFFVLAAANVKSQVNDNRLHSADSLLQTMYKANEPGISITIVQKGVTVFKKSYGVADISTQEKITSSSNFNIASLTKQFTALAILQLEQQGKLSLEDTLSRFFPTLNKKVADEITIKQLLTHTSGIVDSYDYTNTKNMRHAHIADVLDAIKDVDSTYFIPGSRFHYSNSGFCMLALVIEKISGMTYAGYMQKNIFNPAGMGHTVIWNENANIPFKVTAYDLDSATNRFKVSGPDESIFFSTEGDGGIYTSIDDYTKWFNALQSGKIFSAAIVKEARSMQFKIEKKKMSGYGFGWFIDESSTPSKVYHSGSNGGFRTYSFTIPEDGYMILIFSNRSDIDLEELMKKINDILTPGKSGFTKIEELTS